MQAEWQLAKCPSADSRNPPVFDASSRFVLHARGTELVLINVQTGETAARDSFESPIVAVIPHPTNHNLILLVLNNGELCVWSIESSEELSRRSSGFTGICYIKQYHRQNINNLFVAVSSNNKRYAHLHHVQVDIENLTKCELKKRKVIGKIPNDQNLVDVTPDFVTVAKGQSVQVFDLNGKVVQNVQMRNAKRKLDVEHEENTTDNHFTCVVAHYCTQSIAAGDLTGRIRIWKNVLAVNSDEVCQILHWHSLPVTCLHWSLEGASLYSGGQERVVVKWVLHRQSTDNREFLARLPAAISSITTSVDQALVSIAMHDTSVQIVSSALLPVLNMRGLSRRSHGIIADVCIDVDGLSSMGENALVLNAQPGCIQFYNPDSRSSQLVDVTGLNEPPAVRGQTLACCEVVKIAVYKGYLATVQFRDDPIIGDECVLKIWTPSADKISFLCVGAFDSPHRQQVTDLKFSKVSGYLVSCGRDGVFKLWNNNDQGVWDCCGLQKLRNLPCVAADFCGDSHKIAVAFGSFVTVWNYPQLKKVQERNSVNENDSINSLVWNSSMIVVSSEKQIIAMNCLTLEIMWIVNSEAQSLTKDPHSNYMAAISNDYLTLFTTSDPNPILRVKNSGQKPLKSCCFGGKEREENSLPELYAFNAQMHPLKLCLKSEDWRMENVKLSEMRQETAFARLLQETRAENLPAPRDKLSLKGRNPFVGAVHSLPPVNKMAFPFIKACLTPKSDLQISQHTNYVLKRELTLPRVLEKKRLDLDEINIDWMIDHISKL